MSSPFTVASTVRAVEPSVFSWAVPDGWQQGRGAFGGLVIGALVRAMEASEPEAPRVLRTLGAELVAPALPGPSLVHVSTLRRGSNITFLEARLVQSGAVVARASGTLAAARGSGPRRAPRPAPPTVAPWDALGPARIEPPFGPVFSRWYEYRPDGGLPFSGLDGHRITGWLREGTPPERLDAAALVGLADAWWPAFLASETTPRAVATVGFTLEILADPASVPPDQRFVHRGEVIASHEGYFVELRELWAGDRLVAMNQQTFAILS